MDQSQDKVSLLITKQIEHLTLQSCEELMSDNQNG